MMQGSFAACPFADLSSRKELVEETAREGPVLGGGQRLQHLLHNLAQHRAQLVGVVGVPETWASVQKSPR